MPNAQATKAKSKTSGSKTSRRRVSGETFYAKHGQARSTAMTRHGAKANITLDPQGEMVPSVHAEDLDAPIPANNSNDAPFNAPDLENAPVLPKSTLHQPRSVTFGPVHYRTITDNTSASTNTEEAPSVVSEDSDSSYEYEESNTHKDLLRLDNSDYGYDGLEDAEKYMAHGTKPTRAKPGPTAKVHDLDIVIHLTGTDKKTRILILKSPTPYTILLQRIQELLNLASEPQELCYRTSWANKTSQTLLEDASGWDHLVSIVKAKIQSGSRIQDGFHIEIFYMDGGNLAVAKGKAGKGAPPMENSKGVEENFFARILAKHQCDKHTHQCFVIPPWFRVPDSQIGTCRQITNKMMIQWAELCHQHHAGIDDLPQQLVIELMGFQKENKVESNSNQPFQSVAPIPQGKTGSTSVQASAPPSDDGSTFLPQMPTFPPMIPTLQPGFTGVPSPHGWYHPFAPPPFIIGSLPSPMKRALGALPTATDYEGDSLKDWLPELDEKLGSGTTYQALYPRFDQQGMVSVRDITRCSAEELQKNIGCVLGVAKHLLEKAHIHLGTKPA
ncbi:hypothetical protein FRB91_000798 [Serendipita sp. 411]|nr:hypothetical protein FRC18_011589 [Serendipita sp. 400]KAG8846436.1 hypothetical protein FRB91_000798 [Serendipita sp. 411]